MHIIDMAASPNYNPETNSGRGDWSLFDVSMDNVFLDSIWCKPTCRDHNAMNAINLERTIWRCLNCGRSCYMVHNQ